MHRESENRGERTDGTFRALFYNIMDLRTGSQIRRTCAMDGWTEAPTNRRRDVPSEHPSEISSRYVRASEPPLSWGGSVGGGDGFILVWVNMTQ